MKQMLLLWAVVGVVAAGCGPAGNDLTDEQENRLRDEVETAADAWWASWEGVELEKGLSFLSTAEAASWVGDEETLYGTAAMREAWTPWAAALAGQEIEFVDSRTEILAPDLAYTIREYTGTSTRADGTVSPRFSGVETLVWTKEDGAWKVLKGHEASKKDSWQTRLAFEAQLEAAEN